MKSTRLLLVASLATAAFAAQADGFDAPENARAFQGSKTRAEVQAELGQYKQAGVNPWSTSYNQLAGFNSGRTRAEVQADYVTSRDRVSAFTSEDSGSAYLAAHKSQPATARFAGQPANGGQ
jgi:hypothetical protein